MNEFRARPRPGAPQRAGASQAPIGTFASAGQTPVDRTPRVPPNNAPRPVVQPRQSEPVPPPREEGTRSSAIQEHAPQVAPALGNEFERVGLTSRYVMYPWNEISIRKIVPFDHAKIIRAGKHQNLTIMLDAIGSTVNRDPRDLAVSDFYSLCHWHKVNSYPASPTTVSWNSRYGGRPTDKVMKTKLVPTELNRTREEYLEWTQRGFACPTMRDLEIINTLHDEETAIMFEMAQFINVEPLKDRVAELRKNGDSSPTVTARVEELNRRGTACYADIEKFADLFANFGVEEVATVTNNSMVPSRAIEALRSTGEQADAEEADLIARAVAEKRTYQPKSEEVPLVFNLWHLFPFQ